MATATLSGYITAATPVGMTGATQKIDSALDNEWTDLSDEIDNTNTLYMFADLYVALGSILPTTDASFEVYLIPSVDGTNYPDWTGDSVADQPENSQYFVGSISLKLATETQEGVLRNVALPNGKYKFGFRNRANVTLNATGNSVSWRPHGYASA